MEKTRIFLAVALLIILSVNLGYGFDIAIYYDPLSYFNQGALDCYRNWNTHAACDEFWLNQSYNPSQMDSVYTLYKEMGVTYVMVNYIDSTNFDWIRNDSTHIKLLNWNYPGLNGFRGDKYVDAQYRDVDVGIEGAYWTFSTSIGSGATRTNSPALINRPSLPVVRMSGSAGTLWQPTSILGNMSGWDWMLTGWQDSSIFMPMHFKLTWAVDPNGPISTETALADFFWIVQAPSDTVNGVARDRWWRFPAKTLTLPSLSDTNNWIVSNFVDSAGAGDYYLLDENFNVLNSIPMDGIHTGPTNPPYSLDDVYLNGAAYGANTAVRMSVWYRGIHSFYLNRIEIYDEGAYRMFASPDSAHYDSLIWEAFRDEYSNANGKLAGWYYDEWDVSGDKNGNPVLRSIVKINKLLHDHTLPTFFMNGHPSGQGGAYRGTLMDKLQQEGLQLSCHMEEFYPFRSPHWCFPLSADAAWGLATPHALYTSSVSDTTYLTAINEGCNPGTFQVGGCTNIRYSGWKSLQAAIDGEMWDWMPAYALASPAPMEYCPHSAFEPGDSLYTGLIPQVAYVHSRQGKIWALLQGGPEGANDESYCCPLRSPSPNEIKLEAWLAVACNVDGIMWYPLNFGGFIEMSGWPLVFHPDSSGRYNAAKKVCQEIQHLSPILESLEFVKTYASRAFERSYPDSTQPATQLDTLADGLNWHGQPHRFVESITALAPDPNNGGWAQMSEPNPYVQVTRYRNPLVPLRDPTKEDYWFLIVNRRALPTEQRKITLVIQVDTAYSHYPYRLDYVLGDSTRIAAPCAQRVPTCAMRWVEVVLDPGEAELMHFYRSDFGCDSTYFHIPNVTATHLNPKSVRLSWAPVTMTDDSLPFTVDTYFVCGSTDCDGLYTPIGSTSTTTFVDSVFTVYSRYYYQVQACGTVDQLTKR